MGFNGIYDMLTMLPGIIIAMSFHEFAHAYVAHKMGDDTANQMGRMTINPVSHIDPIGLVMLLVGGFGWAKPVPVNENNFYRRKTGIFLVSLAGVAMNILIAILAIIIYSLTYQFVPGQEYEMVMDNIAWINIAFAAFNLMPIPPLDGSKLIVAFLPASKRFIFYQYEKYGLILMILLISTGVSRYLLSPIVLGIIRLINFVVGLVL